MFGPRFRWMACLTVVVALMAASCAGDDGGADAAEAPASSTTEAALEPQAGGTLRYALDGETNSFDPVGGQWSSNAWVVARSIFDSLMDWTADGELKPFLAESFEPNEDYSVWTITPREGVVMHNGEVLDAELIKLNLDRNITSPFVGGRYAGIETVEVVDGTVVITLDEPWVQFAMGFTGQPGLMVAREMIENPQGGSNPIGTGPFVFESWVVDDELVVSRNDGYWNGPVYLDGVEFRVIQEHETRSVALKAGEFDVAPFLMPEHITEMRGFTEEGQMQVFEGDGEGDEFLFLINLDRPPFDDIRVREALISALDRQAMVDELGGGLAPIASGIYAPDSPWYAETDYPEFDPDHARALVEEWETETGENLRVRMGAVQEPQGLANLQWTQSAWEDVGIETEIEAVQLAEFIQATVVGDYDVNIWQWYSKEHPDLEYNTLHSDAAGEPGSGALNFGRIRDPEIDAALEEARDTDDPERQYELYAEVQRLMTEGRYHVFLQHTINTLAAIPEVHGLGEWTFPDGTPGLGMKDVQARLGNVWLSA